MSCSTPLRRPHSKVSWLLACSHTTFGFNVYGSIASQSANQNGSNNLIHIQSSSKKG